MTEQWTTFGFGQPWWLALLVIVPLLAWRHGHQAAALQYSAVDLLKKLGTGVKTRRGSRWAALYLLALALLIIAMARPRLERGGSSDFREGVDIVLAVDVSGSMDEKDFNDGRGGKISRRDALIQAIGDFVDHRPNDRFGMIGFAGNTYLMSPLTTDGEWIKNILKTIKTQNGTAIGEGIVASVQLLKEAKGKSKIIIVATDGENNAGIAPMTAAEMAAKAGIRMHGIVISNVIHSWENEKSLMTEITQKTGGLNFRATNLNTMVDVYRQIDKMEKSKFEQRKFRVYDELHPWLVLPAFSLLLIGLVAGQTHWMRLP
jgi:Ca-activated chloride channel family protein